MWGALGWENWGCRAGGGPDRAFQRVVVSCQFYQSFSFICCAVLWHLGEEQTWALQPQLLCFDIYEAFMEVPSTSHPIGLWCTKHTWHGPGSKVVSRCCRCRWAASPVMGTEVCRSCGKNPWPPASFCATGFLIFCFSRPIIPSYWVMGSWGFFWSTLKCYCKSTQVHGLLLTALFPYLHPPPHPFSLSPFPHYCGKGRKGKETLQKWKISLLYHKDELCNHFPLSKELKDNKSPN